MHPVISKQQWPCLWINRFVVTSGIAAGIGCAALAARVEIDHRLQLFVDHALIERMENIQLRLHSPERREVVFTFDAPWEGPESACIGSPVEESLATMEPSW